MRLLSFAPPRQHSSSLRLILAVAGSIAVHATAVSLYAPGGAGEPAKSAQTPVLHAVLAPADMAPSASADDAAGGKRAQADADGTGANAGNGLPAPDRWFRRSELDTVAAPITAVALDYPERAKKLTAGRVQMRLFIDERGLVQKLTVEEHGPERAFDEAATKAWQGVRFSPAIKNGAAVKSQQVIEVDFQPEVAQR